MSKAAILPIRSKGRCNYGVSFSTLRVGGGELEARLSFVPESMHYMGSVSAAQLEVASWCGCVSRRVVERETK